MSFLQYFRRLRLCIPTSRAMHHTSLLWGSKRPAVSSYSPLAPKQQKPIFCGVWRAPPVLSWNRALSSYGILITERNHVENSKFWQTISSHRFESSLFRRGCSCTSSFRSSYRSIAIIPFYIISAFLLTPKNFNNSTSGDNCCPNF